MKYFFTLLFLSTLLVQAQKKNLYIICAEDEYSTEKTLPDFARQTLSKDFNIRVIKPHPQDRNLLQYLESIRNADLLMISAWRLALQKPQMRAIKAYLNAGKPLIAMRTTTHAFWLRNNLPGPKGSIQWPDFDQEILGCNYNGHESSNDFTKVTLEKKNSKHPILNKIKNFSCRSWLYNVKPMNPKANILMWGQTRQSDIEPVAWTTASPANGKVFTTTLGHSEDFMQMNFVRLLHNACYWAVNKKIPSEVNYQFFGDYVEEHFPFYTSTVSKGTKQKKALAKDVTARGFILKPGQDHYACFDADLLRYSSIWKNGTLARSSMAPGSYNLKSSSKKSSQGEFNLPTHQGTTIASLRSIPGIEKNQSTWKDPRTAATDPKQVNNGPLPTNKGHWNGIFLTEEGPILSYSLGQTEIFENLRSQNHKDTNFLQRRIQAVNVDRKTFIHIGEFDAGAIATTDDFVFIKTEEGKGVALKLFADQPCRFVNRGERIDLEILTTKEININLHYWEGEKKRMEVFQNYQNNVFRFPDVNRTPPPYWPETEKTKIVRAKKQPGANFLIDEIPLPFINNMKRNIRLSGVAFFDDGRAALTTFDGDVWIVSDLDQKYATWKRFASGLNELQSIVIKNQQIYVFGRSGITRLHDRDNNGEADYYENFCNLPIQTAETREFPMDMKLHPDGSFIIAKGGQRTQTINPHAGSVIKVAANGKSIKVIADHLREPYLGIDPDNGEIFASDQQGHWTPATPFYSIKQGGYHGFIPGFQKKNKETFSEPISWLPHRINQSGSGILKIKSKKLAFVNNKFFYLDFNGPSLGLFYYNSKESSNAPYIRLKEHFNFPLLKAAINPKDRYPYVTGFKIWGTNALQLSGFARLRPANKKPTLPKDIEIYKQGVLLRFHQKVLADSINPHLFSLERWNYLRSSKYGSGHYLRDGKPGQEKIPLSSVTLSKDKKAVFIAIPNMVKTEQMSLSWRLIDEAQQSLDQSTYFTINTLKDFTSQQVALFPTIDFNAPALKNSTTGVVKASLELGKATVEKLGCVTCHSLGSEREGKFGPAWKGIFDSQRTLADDSQTKVDSEYLKESIMKPAAKVVKGFQAAMPSYEGIIQAHELESIILYLKSLK
jgi:type 1 glutamine amidotransferase/cytochrome c2